jgi:hypothetical protein
VKAGGAPCWRVHRAPARARSLKMIFGTYRCDSGGIVVGMAATRSTRHCAGQRMQVAPHCSRLCQPVSARRAARGGDRCGHEPLVVQALRDRPGEGGRPAVSAQHPGGFGRCRRRRFRAGAAASISPGFVSGLRLLLDEPPPSTPVATQSWSTWWRKKAKRDGVVGHARPDVRTAIATPSLSCAVHPDDCGKIMSASGLVVECGSFSPTA